MVKFGFHSVLKLFNSGSVFVVGRKGSGKDVIMGNACVRQNKPYVGNIDYDSKELRHEFNIDDFNIHNTYDNFLKNDIYEYVFPYEEGTDIFISDGGAYFPNFATLQLNKKYEGFIYFVMLSRQISNTSVHVNTQAYGRIWDKLREQFHYYVLCKRCRWFVNISPNIIKHIPLLRNIVAQTIVVYERPESCETEAIEFRVKPPRKRMLRGGAKDETAKQVWESQKMAHETQYGKVKKMTLIYINRSKHDSRRFREILKNGKKQNKK